MMRRTWLALALALPLLACGRLTTEHVVTGVDRGASGGPVGIVMENEPPPPQFEEVALVRAFGEGNRANLSSVIEGLQREARLVGANAVIRVRIDQGGTGMSGLGVAVVVP
jgi:hypothetical protein